MILNVLALLLVLLMPSTLSPGDEEGLRELGHWLDLPPNVAHADALVVIGGDAQQRVIPGIELFQQGMAPELWYTGGGASMRAAVDLAVEMGVSPDAITFLPGSSTWEDTQKIALEFRARDLDSVLIVTSWYHGRRTLCALQQHLQGSDVQIYYQPVGYDDYGPDNWWLSETGQKVVFSELTKFGYYWLTYNLNLQDC